MTDYYKDREPKYIPRPPYNPSNKSQILDDLRRHKAGLDTAYVYDLLEYLFRRNIL